MLYEGKQKKETYSAIVLRRLLRRKGAILGIIIVSFFVIVALTASIIAPYDPIECYPIIRLSPPP
ncbi:hypothetical protein ES705_05203 [subsurface metagenome]